MTNYCGYMGKVVLLDLDAKTTTEYPWSDRDRELYIGGKAMASKVLYDNLTGTEDPFGPENLIVISTGPLTGIGAPSSNRFDISALSPLTGITTSSNCGGNFGHYLKKAGMDALIIRGRCESPTWIEIENDKFTMPAEAAADAIQYDAFGLFFKPDVAAPGRPSKAALDLLFDTMVVIPIIERCLYCGLTSFTGAANNLRNYLDTTRMCYLIRVTA